MKIAIIGTGNLGYSIAQGILSQDNFTLDNLYLTKRNKSSLSSFEKFPKVKISSNNKEAIQYSDVIILAVQPNQLIAVLEEVKTVIDTKRHTIISVITGRKIHEIEAIVGGEIAIIRSMPNTAISVGQSMTCISANEKGKENIEFAKTIFNSLGNTLYIEEKLMQSATVICASGIAFWMRLIRATAQGAVQLGFHADEAQELAMQTCLGAASLLIQSGSHPEQEIDKVTTPSGCTISGLNEMEHQGLSSSIIKGLVTSFEKINQI
ncbi:MAG: pyrroline-5-carboxylate reductase [Lutibacter sp.]|uniref:pyrroline-5-carboxylate reductase n=1 Tax=Lutibacter sp. TaxID=1925666 RepID=UPI00182CA770|nr:pyrroline-5-carboxylate reductase [Lutibacter sp.]MBT8316411.1 pyrroline-5-carboxylate reductase [Lutibacter sp.]NNJ57271.1 pyrroline-5-carboxylate reductase [Lutibacter sp.]